MCCKEKKPCGCRETPVDPCNPCAPKCNEECLGCDVEVKDECVTTTEDLECLGLPKGTLYSEVIQAIDEKLCENQSTGECEVLDWQVIQLNENTETFGGGFYALTCQGEVKLKGFLTFDDYELGNNSDPSSAVDIPTNLPEPSENKFLTLNYFESVDLAIVAGLLKIKTDGKIAYYFNIGANRPSSPELCLDGLSYFIE